MEVYVYEEYRDDMAWSDRSVSVFKNYADGIQYLRERAETWFGTDFDHIAEEVGFNENNGDVCNDNWVQFKDWQDTVYFTLEACTVA